MGSLKQLLFKLDETLKADNPIEYEKLLPALVVSELEKKLSRISITDVGFRTLYEWKSGALEESRCQIMDYGAPMSLDNIQEVMELDLGFDKRLIPLISEGEEMLLFNSKPGKCYGMLYLYSVSLLYIDYPISYYDSLEKMIETTVLAYQKKIYFYDHERDQFVTKYEELHQLTQKMNPKSAYWSEHNPLREQEWYEI